MTKEVKYYFGIPFKVRGASAAPAERAQPATKPKFKVGDRVRTDAGYSFDPSVGTICKVTPEYYDVHLDVVPDTHSKDVWSYSDEDLSLVPTFTPGQRVRLTRNVAGYARGDIGVVEVVGELIGVIMNDRYVYRIFPADALEVVAEPWGEAKPKFKAGDVVRCLKDAHEQFTKGRTYVVKEYPTIHGNVGIERDDRGSTGNGWDEKHFELVSAADCAERNGQHGIKAGDWVRALEDAEPGRQFTKGSFYQVRGVVGRSIQIVADDKGSATNGWGVENFELVTPKFKAGDRVTTDACEGHESGVVLRNNGDGSYQVRFPAPYNECREVEGDLRLASASSNHPCIVARVTNGQPRPADRPYVHASVEAATTEAERLARNNPGQEFAVYQRVGARVAEVHVEMKEVA